MGGCCSTDSAKPEDVVLTEGEAAPVKGGKGAGGNSFLIVNPCFTVVDKAKAEEVMAEFVEKSKTEQGCIYYGWQLSEDGTKLFCREAYDNGEAVNAHLENVGPCIGKILADGVCKLDSINIMGPAAELELVKPGTKDRSASLVGSEPELGAPG